MTNGFAETPFKLTSEEVLASAAATVCLLQLAKAGTQERTLDEICFSPQYGFTASASVQPCGPRFVRITDIRAGTVDWQTVPFCNCPNPSAYELTSGDILIARSGSVGKSFMVTKVPESAVFASYMIRLRARAGTAPSYVYWCLQSQQFWQQIMGARRGSAMKNINGKMLASLRFPHPDTSIQNAMVTFLEGFRERLRGGVRALPELPPPLSEQPRIVARIEELATKIEEARGLRRETVEANPTIIRTTVSSIDTDLLASYGTVRLDQLASQDKGSMRSGPFGSSLLHSEFVEEGVPAIGIEDVQENRFVLSRRWHVTHQKATELARFRIKPADILITVMGTLGRTCVVPNDVPHMISTKHVWTVTLNPDRAFGPWVSYWLNFSARVRTDLLGQTTGTAIGGLNGQKIRAVNLPSIPLPEQRDTVTYLDDLQAKVDALKRLQTETAAEMNALLPSILDKAFRGEL